MFLNPFALLTFRTHDCIRVGNTFDCIRYNKHLQNMYIKCRYVQYRMLRKHYI